MNLMVGDVLDIDPILRPFGKDLMENQIFRGANIYRVRLDIDRNRSVYRPLFERKQSKNEIDVQSVYGLEREVAAFKRIPRRIVRIGLI